MGYIYLRTNSINGKKYVGQATTKRFKARQAEWKSIYRHYAGKAINAARAKYGIDAFDFEILKECKDEELDYWEKYYIKELNTKVPYGYNMTDGGEGCSGSSVSDETKKKISETLKGNIPWNKGKTNIYSEEWRKKQREAHKGKAPWNKGKQWSEEWKQKMSETKKGIPNIKLSKPVLQVDKDTNEVIAEFPSVAEIYRQFGYHHSNIVNSCRGKLKSAYGFKWQYK